MPGVLAVEEAGITPDSPFWGLDVAMDKFSLALTANDAKRAQKALRISDERLSELEAMVEKEDVKRAQKAQEAHEKVMQRLERDLEKLSEKDDEEEYAEGLALESQLVSHNERVTNLRLKVDGELSGEQQAALDALIGSLGDDVYELEIRIKKKNDDVRVKLKERLSDDELSDLEGDSYEHLADVAQAQAQREIARARQKLAEFEEEYFDELAEARGQERPSRVARDFDSGQRRGTEVDINESDSDEFDDDVDDSDEVYDDENTNLITGQVTRGSDQKNSVMNGSDDVDINESDSDELDDEESDHVECSVDADCDLDEYCSSSFECEDFDDDEFDDDDTNEFEEEYEDDSDDKILREFGLVLPEYDQRGANVSQLFIDQAQDALATSYAKEEVGEYKAAYAYAKFSKKLANSAMKGKYLHLSAAQEAELDRLEAEREAQEDLQEDLEDAECSVDADCDLDEYCSSSFECEDFDDFDEEDEEADESDELECSVDTDCDADEFCDDGECVDLDDSDDEFDDDVVDDDDSDSDD